MKEQRVGQADLAASGRCDLALLLGSEKTGGAGIPGGLQSSVSEFCHPPSLSGFSPREEWHCLPSQAELVLVVSGGLLL